MSFFRRSISLIVGLILIFSLLASCGNNTTNVNDSSEPAEPTPAEVVETEEEEVVTEETEEEEVATEEIEEEPVEEATEASEPSGGEAGADQTWLIMMYQDADDEVLEKDIFVDLNEAEMIGSTDQVTIVSQIDRMDGGYDGGDDWTSTKRFLVGKDDSGDLEALVSEELEDLGELDMGSKDTLVDFATWAIETYPSDRYVLILSDHGAGWTGGWTDNAPNEGSQMLMKDIDEALAAIVEQSGIGQFELVGFDACLMSQMDVLSGVAPYARYAVASEETEPSLGWAYSSFLGALVENPGMDGAELSSKIVDSYIIEDGRLTDEMALENFAKDLSSPGATAEEITSELDGDITLTAIDLAKLSVLNNAINELAVALQDVDQSSVAEARAYAQSYTNIFGDETPPSFIDLGSFASLLVEVFEGEPVAEAANGVLEAIQDITIAEKHGPDRAGSTGITLYFPDADLYSTMMNPDIVANYLEASGRFVTASLWDDFLAFHYASNPIDPDAVDVSVIEPQSQTSDFNSTIEASALPENVEIVKPGAGEVDFKSLTASAESISIEDTVILSAELAGTNVGYMYLYTAYYDEESNSYLTTDMDFVASEETKEVAGISYPDWGDGEDLSMDINWEPVVWTISDGTNDALAAAEAETYGETAETTFYRVWGTYQLADSDEKYEAYLRFDANGELDSVIIFSKAGENSAPREYNPGEGDQFTVAEEWLEFDENPDGEYAYYEGDTVTFGEDGFTMVANEGMAGNYVIGLIVEDLEGTTFEQYIEIEVTE